MNKRCHSSFKKGFLPIEQIVQIDPNGIYTSQQHLSSADQHEEYIRYNQLKHKMIINPEKEQLGILEDVYISFQAGTMVTYEISDGFLQICWVKENMYLQ